MADKVSHTWPWQPYGTPWKGVAIYHDSFSVNHSLPDRLLLGKVKPETRKEKPETRWEKRDGRNQKRETGNEKGEGRNRKRVIT